MNNNNFNEQKVVKKIWNYFNDWQLKKIKKVFNEGIEFIEIDIEDLEMYTPNLTMLLFSFPSEIISLFESTLMTFKENLNQKDVKVRFKNLPDSEKISLSKISTEHEDTLIKFRGMIKRKSERLPKIKYSDHLCTNPSCHYFESPLRIQQLNDKIRKVKVCPKCKSHVELTKEVSIPFQNVIIEEDISESESVNNQPQSKSVELEYDLTSPLMNNDLLVGSKVEVTGIVRAKHQETQKGKNTVGEFYIEANNISTLEENITKIHISKEEKEQIIELSQREDIEQLLTNSIAPNIAGRTEQKLASLFYVVGGSDRQDKKTKLKQRSHIHLKIIGNASLGKSQILKRLNQLLPKSVYVSAENATNAGIIGTVVKDEFTGNWAVEAGSMPMASGGYYLQDESDKLKPEDLTKQNQALEDQKATMNKAGINIDLITDCPCFSVANPKNGRFNEDQDYIKQINFDPTYLSRFDLIFILDGKDGDEEQDLVLDRLCGFDLEDFETLDDDLLRKYLMYAKNLNPTISRDLLGKLKNYYINISNMAKRKNSIDITYRQFTGLIRMSEARAKLYLRNEVLLEDVKEVMKLMDFTLRKLDLSEITTGISNTNRSLAELIPDIIRDLENNLQKPTMENIIKAIEKLTTKFNKQKIEKMLNQMKYEGEVYCPRKNEYKLLG